MLGGEAAWAPAAARDIIDFLRHAGFAVVGVEVWLPEGENPRVWGWSEYDVPFVEDWDQYVEANAIHALAELARDAPPDAVYNLAWISRDELQSPIDSSYPPAGGKGRARGSK